jgi:hypothetical protein
MRSLSALLSNVSVVVGIESGNFDDDTKNRPLKLPFLGCRNHQISR